MSDEFDYKPNSFKAKEKAKQTAKEPEKKVEKVIDGVAKVKKKNSVSKFTDVFVAEDVKNVKSYILMDVLVPAIKKAVKDIVTDGVEMLLYGESGRGRKGSTNASYVNYNKISDRRSDDRFRSSSVRNGFSHDDIILESYAEADEVLTRMSEAIETYGVVSIADMYDLVGLPHNYTHNKYGWTNLRNAEPVRTRDGYMLKLPRALPID